MQRTVAKFSQIRLNLRKFTKYHAYYRQCLTSTPEGMKYSMYLNSTEHTI